MLECKDCHARFNPENYNGMFCNHCGGVLMPVKEVKDAGRSNKGTTPRFSYRPRRTPKNDRPP